MFEAFDKAFDVSQLWTNLDPILNYCNIYTEWRKRLIQDCVKFEQVLPPIGDLFVDCKHSRLFVNEHFLYVQCIILYHSYVVVEKEFVKKERNSFMVISLSAASLLQNPTTVIAKYNWDSFKKLWKDVWIPRFFNFEPYRLSHRENP